MLITWETEAYSGVVRIVRTKAESTGGLVPAGMKWIRGKTVQELKAGRYSSFHPAVSRSGKKDFPDGN